MGIAGGGAKVPGAGSMIFARTRGLSIRTKNRTDDIGGETMTTGLLLVILASVVCHKRD